MRIIFLMKLMKITLKITKKECSLILKFKLYHWRDRNFNNRKDNCSEVRIQEEEDKMNRRLG